MNEDLNSIISHNLSSLRKGKGLTQGELGEHFSYSDKAISKWEKGESLPDLITLKSLADFYEVTLDYLVTSHKDEDLIEQGKNPPNKIFKQKIILVLFALCTLISLFVIGDFILRIKPLPSWNSFQVYFWMMPSLAIVASFFFRHFKWKLASFISFVIFVWLLALAFYLELGYDWGKNGWNSWFILFSPIPITLILCWIWFLFLKKKNT